MRKRGRVILLCNGVCLLGGLGGGKVEFYIISAILSGMLLMGLLLALSQRPRLSLDLGAGRVMRGEEMTIAVVAKNPYPWPIFPMRLTLSLLWPGQDYYLLISEAKYEGFLRGYGEKHIETEITCPHCGEYEVFVHKYYGEDVFGLFSLPGPAIPGQTLLSLPRLTIEAGAEHGQGARENEGIRGRPGRQGQLTAESRLYRQGDSMRLIHWKKSASRHMLFSRLREQSADYSCYLLPDTRPYGQGEEAANYQDTLREAALSFLFHELKANHEVILLPGGLGLHNLGMLDKAGAVLAALACEGDLALGALKELLASSHPGGVLYLLSGQPYPHLDEALAQLSAGGWEIIPLNPLAADGPVTP